MSTEGFRAEVIADSVSPTGTRLTTLQLKYPRFIHSEFMTHRVFSRNASSSRAIPVAKEIERVLEVPAMPIHWGKNQPGMQAREELSETSKAFARALWGEGAEAATDIAKEMQQFSIHKQVTNRLLEPFQWIDVVVTATEWENFFHLRDHEDAQPEIRFLAQKMREAMDASTPVELSPGEWHLPYVTEEDRKECRKMADASPYEWEPINDLRNISAARCARVSYRNHDGSKCGIQEDLHLAGGLLLAGHMSPFEHQGTPMFLDWHVEETWPEGVTHIDRYGDPWSGNFRQWVQYRQLI